MVAAEPLILLFSEIQGRSHGQGGLSEDRWKADPPLEPQSIANTMNSDTIDMKLGGGSQGGT